LKKIIFLYKVNKVTTILNQNVMTAAFLPPILVPVVTLVFPGLCFALFFVLIEQEEVA